MAGNVNAQNRLGFIEINKESPNWSNALFWFNMAADRGSADACLWLGYSYENGLGTSKNQIRAVLYYQKGASLGSINCAKSLAVFFEKEKKYISAYAWKSIYSENEPSDQSSLKFTKFKELSARDKEYAMILAQEIKQTWSTKTESPIWDPIIQTPRFGRMELDNNSVYDGIIFKDRPNGFGTLRSVGGETYYGYFKNGQKHGYGTLYKQDGTVVFEGSWLNNIPTQPSK